MDALCDVCGRRLTVLPVNYTVAPDDSRVCWPCFDAEPYAYSFPETER